uniref:Uncharacterized protein n=1 Tax=Anopheles atroparvus TaxID=41427 RepID=A0A182J9T3_ANOAO
MADRRRLRGGRGGVLRRAGPGWGNEARRRRWTADHERMVVVPKEQLARSRPRPSPTATGVRRQQVMMGRRMGRLWSGGSAAAAAAAAASECRGPPVPGAIEGAVLETIVTEDDEDDEEEFEPLELGVIGRIFCCWAAAWCWCCCCWAAAMSGEGSRSLGGAPRPLPADSGGCNRASISPRPISDMPGGMGPRAGCMRGDRLGEVTEGGSVAAVGPAADSDGIPPTPGTAGLLVRSAPTAAAATEAAAAAALEDELVLSSEGCAAPLWPAVVAGVAAGGVCGTESGREDGAALLLLLLPPGGPVPLPTAADEPPDCGGRLGGGRAAGAGDGAGGAGPAAAQGGAGTGLALPARPSGPLLSGSPVEGCSDFRGAAATAAGLEAAVVGCVCGVDANTTDPPSEPCRQKWRIRRSVTHEQMPGNRKPAEETEMGRGQIPKCIPLRRAQSDLTLDDK